MRFSAFWNQGQARVWHSPCSTSGVHRAGVHGEDDDDDDDRSFDSKSFLFGLSEGALFGLSVGALFMNIT